PWKPPLWKPPKCPPPPRCCAQAGPAIRSTTTTTAGTPTLVNICRNTMHLLLLPVIIRFLPGVVPYRCARPLPSSFPQAGAVPEGAACRGGRVRDTGTRACAVAWVRGRPAEGGPANGQGPTGGPAANGLAYPGREMPSFFIFHCRVERAMPRRAAAPLGPRTT